MGLNTDFSCGRASGPDVAFSGSKDQDLIVISGGSSVHISMAPNGSLAKGLKIALGCSPDHCHLLGPLWKHVPLRGDYTHGLSR